MMRSISLFCGAENSCPAAGSASISSAPAPAPVSVLIIAIISLDQAVRLRRLEARNVVRLDPSGRSYGKTSFGATRQLPSRGQISAIEGRLGGGEIRIREVAFAAIGDGKVVVGVGDLRIVRERLAQVRNRFLDQRRIVGADQRLA